MFKKKFFFAVTAAFLLCFYSNNLSFAIIETDNNNKDSVIYPDYSYEFTGKDKCEGFNRKLFVFNLKLNKFVLKPVNIVWASVMPKYGMDRLQNMYTNINFPVRVVSCALQKDFKGSRQELSRFFINTTVGVAGFYDPAKTKFHIQPRNEDMGQALACCKKIKKGPYLVLPVVRGNLRDLAGQLLDYPLRPFSYIPIGGAIANAVFAINNTVSMQAGIKKIDETYADPYEVAKQLHGFDRFIKNENLDRDEVLKAKSPCQTNMFDVRSAIPTVQLKPDVELTGYNPQSPLVDAMRTAMFKEEKPKKEVWAELSVWNRCFDKKIKLSSVNIDKTHPNYRFRYILQKNKTSPVAIIYPSIGEGIYSEHSDVLAKILYDEGYSVIIQGSAFQWEFVKCMPKGYKPGLPYEDAMRLRQVSAKILDDLQTKKGYKFERKVLIGTSFGAMTGLFAAAQEDERNTLGISKFICINPPIELFYAMRQFDKCALCWKNDPSDIKMRAAVTAQKVLKVSEKINCKKCAEMVQIETESLPFNDEEAKLIMSFVMKQKMSDVVFAIENNSRCKKCKIYNDINKMSFYNYGEKYLFSSQNKPQELWEYETSMRSISDFLKKSDNYKIYQTLDDYYINSEQLAWLKGQSGDKTKIFSNGSHLGYLYRKEFLENLKQDINNVQAQEVVPVNLKEVTVGD